MSDEKKSAFDGLKTDEQTGEIIFSGLLDDILVEFPEADFGEEDDLISAVEEANPEEEESTDLPEETKEIEEAAADTEEGLPEGQESESEENGENDTNAAKEAGEDGLPVLDFDFSYGEEEFVNTTPSETTPDEDMMLKSIDKALAAQMASEVMPMVPEKKKKNFWKRIPLWCRITMIVLLVLCLLAGFLVLTKPGRKVIYGLATKYMYSKLDYVPDPEDEPEWEAMPTLSPTPEPTLKPGQMPTPTPDVTPTLTPTPMPTVAPRQEDYCYNVLLIGVEALPQLGGGGRSDSMILVSINSKDKKIHMTSFMRDMYVPIPNRGYDKLNAAYANGGSRLLVKTIEQNFQIKIDGYVKVGFDNFEWIVNRLGGVEVTLTAEEAEYLQTHDYISNPANRNVVPGTQVMNGNQVLGYCRVRYVPTASGAESDFGRTERQRTVLKKIFNKYKDSDLITMFKIFSDCLPKVTTNISKQDMQKMMEMVVEEKILSLDTMRLPISGGYVSERLDGGTGPWVLQVDWTKNINALHEYVFGSVE